MLFAAGVPTSAAHLLRPRTIRGRPPWRFLPHSRHVHGRLEVEDCHQGRLLLRNCDTNELTVFDPVARRVLAKLTPPRHGNKRAFHHNSGSFLIPGRVGDQAASSSSFRVVTMQRCTTVIYASGGDQRLDMERLAVYDSSTGAWSARPWTSTGDIDMPLPLKVKRYSAMHAPGRICWKRLRGGSPNSLVSLDAETMGFPEVVPPPGVLLDPSYAVGDTDDGSMCLVNMEERETMRLVMLSKKKWHLRVWLLGKSGCGGRAWVLDQEQEASLTTSTEDAADMLWDYDQACRIVAVNAGVVLMCLHSPRRLNDRYIAFRLSSLQVVASFSASELVFQYQMPWPPVLLPTA
ncbi:hypothetical protein OsI_36077 [Oryza sativa Indica Group]|uniref:F-box associated domain-containing protein n=2 Tax=Oryza TaxID=4527 RepID=A0A0E0HAG6_ORYNI|nr:hypothetical protein OsI_36077 [Oryza sativa Indica Group]